MYIRPHVQTPPQWSQSGSVHPSLSLASVLTNTARAVAQLLNQVVCWGSGYVHLRPALRVLLYSTCGVESNRHRRRDMATLAREAERNCSTIPSRRVKSLSPPRPSQ